jgi:hypothetical protein
VATKFVRVRDDSTGMAVSVSERRAAQLGDKVTVLDEPAVDRLGNVLPPAPATAEETREEQPK